MGSRYYYIWDQRASGDHALWWRPDCSGYTTNLAEAGLYVEAEARDIERRRGTDVAVPIDVAMSCIVELVDLNRLRECMREWAQDDGRDLPIVNVRTQRVESPAPALRTLFHGNRR